MRDKQRKKIVEEINNYLMEIENDEDENARVLHLLNAAKEMLKEEKGDEGKKERKKINPI